MRAFAGKLAQRAKLEDMEHANTMELGHWLPDVDASTLIDTSQQYGFLGPIVGLSGLLIGAASAILFGWTKTFETFQPPPDVMPVAARRVTTAACAVGLCFIWATATPANAGIYRGWAVGLGIGTLIFFLVYIGLQTYCGRFRQPVPGADSPNQTQVVWGGFWLTNYARSALAANDKLTVEEILKRSKYEKAKVWPPGSRVMAAVAVTLVLLCVVGLGTLAVSTAAAVAQVALTGKATFEVNAQAALPTASVPTASAPPILAAQPTTTPPDPQLSPTNGKPQPGRSPTTATSRPNTAQAVPTGRDKQCICDPTMETIELARCRAQCP